jgi:hypothetical protein
MEKNASGDKPDNSRAHIMYSEKVTQKHCVNHLATNYVIPHLIKRDALCTIVWNEG